jgi:hypothetical protein
METELFHDGSQIKREKEIYHHNPKHILIICHLPEPPSFSLPTTFKLIDNCHDVYLSTHLHYRNNRI